MSAKLKLVDEATPEEELQALLRAQGRVCGSDRFINLTRNPALASPRRFEPTVKAVGDVVI